MKVHIIFPDISNIDSMDVEFQHRPMLGEFVFLERSGLWFVDEVNHMPAQSNNFQIYVMKKQR